MESVSVEEALRRSEERLRVLVRHASDLIAILGADGTMRWHSPSVERALGHAPDALEGTSVYDLVHPEDAPTLRATFDRLAGDPGSTETL